MSAIRLAWRQIILFFQIEERSRHQNCIGGINAILPAPPSIMSGRGSQYVSIRYTARLSEAELFISSVGDSYDNALTETINGLYKAEVIHRRGPWRSFEAI
jgi:transposase InsO family protein